MATHSSVRAWRIPAVYGVAQNRTWLKWLSSSSSSHLGNLFVTYSFKSFPHFLYRIVCLLLDGTSLYVLEISSLSVTGVGNTFSMCVAYIFTLLKSSFSFSATLRIMWALNSPTRNGACAPCWQRSVLVFSSTVVQFVTFSSYDWCFLCFD